MQNVMSQASPSVALKAALSTQCAGVVLLLAGSFFPLHEGHLELLRAARDHCENVLGRQVKYGVFAPTSWTSLCRKFPELRDCSPSDDPRTQWAATVLANSPSCSSWCRWVTPPATGGVADLNRTLIAEAAALGFTTTLVCGTDNKVRAVVRGKSFGDVIVVVDSRGVPEEHKDFLEAGNICLAHTTSNTCYMSSTIERIWLMNQQRSAGTSSLLSLLPTKPFDPTWLTDTGINLGSGRQGIVRLMTLGSRPVAVKWLARGGRYDTFDIEGPLWQSMRGSTLCPEPIVIGTTESFGYIVTEVGVPVNAVLNINYDYRWRAAGECLRNDSASKSSTNVDYPFLQGNPTISLCTLFDTLPAVPTWPPVRRLGSSPPPPQAVPDSDTAPPSQSVLNVAEALKQLRLGVAAVVAAQPHFGCFVVDQIRNRLLPLLQQHEILHRDPKVENLLVFPDGTIRLCDFSVAKGANDPVRIARGKLLMYPPKAVNVASFYNHSCDEYFAAMSSFEALTGVQVYGEFADDVQAALKLKASGKLPQLPSRFWERPENLDPAIQQALREHLDWIHGVWAAHALKPA